MIGARQFTTHSKMLLNYAGTKCCCCNCNFNSFCMIRVSCPDSELFTNTIHREQIDIFHWCRVFSIAMKYRDPLFICSKSFQDVYSLFNLPHVCHARAQYDIFSKAANGTKERKISDLTRRDFKQVDAKRNHHLKTLL